MSALQTAAVCAVIGLRQGMPYGKKLRREISKRITLYAQTDTILREVIRLEAWHDFIAANKKWGLRPGDSLEAVKDKIAAHSDKIYAEKLRQDRRNLVRTKLKNCKSRHQRLACFGAIKVRQLDTQYNQNYRFWVRHISNVRYKRLQAERIRLANLSYQQRIKQQEAEWSRASIQRADEDLTLQELAVKYISGARFADFTAYARTYHEKAPFDIIKGFLKYDPRPIDQRPAPVVEDVGPLPVAANELPAPTAAEIEAMPVEPAKREGKQTQIKTRPDQLTFAQSVEHNCFDTCVVTGSRIHARCSAAHLVEHKDGGADYYTNGLWMRWDIHKLFDDGWCAIDPATMTLHFLAQALELDPDLKAYQGKAIGELRRPIKPENLADRWEHFKAMQNG
ncbi:TPA: HNH endonuclease [Salmonella enterica subsp. enterica serovar Newport]